MNILKTPRRTAAALAMGLSLMAAGCAQQPAAPAAATPAPAARPELEPRAMAILQASCDRLAAARTMSFTALNTYQKAAANGQPLFYTKLNHVTLRRPDGLRVITPGDGPADAFYFDGRTMMAYVPAADLVAIEEAPPNVDALLEMIWQKAAIYFPFADVIASKPCEALTRKLTSAFYIGQSVVVAGTVTDMIAVAGPHIQAQMWIGAKDQLPRMIKVVYPNEAGRALYQTEYSNWRLGIPVSADHFTSARAAKAKRMKMEPPGPAAAPSPSAPSPSAPMPAGGSRAQ